MPTAVLRVVIDPLGELAPAQYDEGVALLRERGHEVIATPSAHLPDLRREIEFIAADPDVELSSATCLRECKEAFGIAPELGVVTFISRGTDDDARGVLRRFAVEGDVRRIGEGQDEVVEVTVFAKDSRRVPESRLHTALEAALNAEVRIVLVDG